MTALSVAAPRARWGAARSVLRLHRSGLIGWAVVVAAVSGVLLWAYGPGASAAETESRRNCFGGACQWATATDRYHLAYTLAEVAISWIPLLVAAWTGAALIGRELESGTAQLAWTQSVSPTRWLAVRFAVPAALLTAGTAVLVLLHRMLFDANLSSGIPVTWHWWDGNTFPANGTLALAHPLLGLAVGALAALLVRRALAALVVAVVATEIVRSLAALARPHLWPWATTLGTLKSGYQGPTNVLYGDQGAVTSTGAHIADPLCGHSKTCLASHHVTGFFSNYHPASHFWPLQLMETGIVLAITATATTTAFMLLRRSTA